MMLVTFMVLPFLAARPVLAQDTLKLDLGKALEIALSENPTVKVADKEIQKKKYARKGSYASLFPQISFAGDYNRTLKKQVMYMDFDMGDMGGGSLPEGTDMSSMDEGFEVGRSNNWSLGFNASIWGNVGASMEVAYSASKGGVNSFTKALAKELAPSNIQVNALACGVIDTDMNHCFTKEERESIINDIPTDRMGTADEAAQAVMMLLHAPAYLTGQIVTMDGGYL